MGEIAIGGEGKSPVLTVDEVAVLLKISRGLAFQGVRDKSIPSIRVGRRILIPRRALMRMLGEGDPGDEPYWVPVEA